jgi:hypothetical protein
MLDRFGLFETWSNWWIIEGKFKRDMKRKMTSNYSADKTGSSLQITLTINDDVTLNHRCSYQNKFISFQRDVFRSVMYS